MTENVLILRWHDSVVDVTKLVYRCYIEVLFFISALASNYRRVPSYIKGANHLFRISNEFFLIMHCSHPQYLLYTPKLHI